MKKIRYRYYLNGTEVSRNSLNDYLICIYGTDFNSYFDRYNVLRHIRKYSNFIDTESGIYIERA